MKYFFHGEISRQRLVLTLERIQKKNKFARRYFRPIPQSRLFHLSPLPPPKKHPFLQKFPFRKFALLVFAYLFLFPTTWQSGFLVAHASPWYTRNSRDATIGQAIYHLAPVTHRGSFAYSLVFARTTRVGIRGNTHMHACVFLSYMFLHLSIHGLPRKRRSLAHARMLLTYVEITFLWLDLRARPRVSSEAFQFPVSKNFARLTWLLHVK